MFQDDVIQNAVSNFNLFDGIKELDKLPMTLRFELASHLAINLLSVEDQYDVVLMVRANRIMWNAIKDFRNKNPNLEPYTHIKVTANPSSKRRRDVFLKPEEKLFETQYKTSNLFDLLKGVTDEDKEESENQENLTRLVESKIKQINDVEKKTSIMKESSTAKIKIEINKARRNIQKVKQIQMDNFRKHMCGRVKMKDIKVEFIKTEFGDPTPIEISRLESEVKRLSGLTKDMGEHIKELNESLISKKYRRLKLDMYAISGWIREKHTMDSADMMRLRNMICVALYSKTDKTFEERLNLCMRYLNINYDNINNMRECYTITKDQKLMEYSCY